MIFTQRTITVSGGSSSIDSPIVIYRGDYNIEVRFTIMQSIFKYSNGSTDSNLIETTDASYAQLIIQTPQDNAPIFSDVEETRAGGVTFTITAEMIDEVEELGQYSFQIRLFDQNQESRVTIPEVKNGMEVREPIAFGADSTTSELGVALVGYALLTAGDDTLDVFDEDGNYIQTTWMTGNTITAAKLNKIEAGIDGVNQKIGSGDGSIDLSEYAKTTDIPTKISQLTNDSGFITTIPSEYVTETELNAKGYLTEHQSLAGYAKTTDIPTTTSQLTNDSGFITSSAIPTIPSTASEITITDTGNNFTATHVEGALAELFQSVSSGKSLIATAITDKGVATSSNETFSSMANKISQITTSSSITTYTITNNLTNCTTDNTVSYVSTGASYIATISVNDGYTLDSITVTMGGTDITSTCVSGTAISIQSVTGNIVVTCTASVPSVYYTITYDLQNCTCTNTVTSVAEGSSYTTTFVPADGYTVNNITVMMGGTNITGSVIAGKTITIPSVTGDVTLIGRGTAT